MTSGVPISWSDGRGQPDDGISALFSPSEFTGLFALNGFSILCSLFVVIFIHKYRNDITVMAATRQQHTWQQRQLSQPQRQRSILRPMGTQAKMYLSLPAPLRLLFIASIVDVLYSVFRIYYLTVSMPGFGGDHQANCKASMTGVTFFNLMSVFVRALLSVHLQLLILSNVTRALAYERHFLIGALLVSLVLSVLPVITNNYVWLSFDPTMGSAHCGYFPLHRTTDDLVDIPSEYFWSESMAQSAMRKGLVIMWATNFAWLTLTVFYGAVVIVSVVIRMIHRRSNVKSLAKNQSVIVEPSQRRREFVHMTTKVVRRILQFPLMVVVCHILEVVYGMATLSRAVQLMRSGLLSADDVGRFESNKTLTRLYLASHIMLGLEGVITLCFLPLEPPIRLMLRSMYLRQRSGLHRLGTARRQGPRQKTPQRQTAMAEPVQRLPSEDSLTVSSFSQLSGSLPSVDGKNISRSPATCDDPGNLYTPATAPPVLSVVVDHVVTLAGQTQNDNNIESRSAPIRRLTRKWMRKSQKRSVQRPPPVYRSRTQHESPWDVVAVPRRRSRTGSVVMQPVISGGIANPALALRNDGLPPLQWYVPRSSSDQADSTENLDEHPAQ
ncbi:hypothetical protein J3F82_000070 [Coemansia sp. RSA 637]|nr:hypothetical protein J3F82_000070 [Coemansia sp. RSA 637]